MKQKNVLKRHCKTVPFQNSLRLVGGTTIAVAEEIGVETDRDRDEALSVQSKHTDKITQ